jgi:hypothetical protein
MFDPILDSPGPAGTSCSHSAVDPLGPTTTSLDPEN